MTKTIKSAPDSRRRLIAFRTHAWRSVLFAVVPVLAFCLMESFGRNPFAQIRSDAFRFNVILFETVAWVLYLLTNCPRIALTLVTATAMVWGLANHYVYTFRSTPLMPWDFYSVRTAASVADNYDFSLDKESWLVILGFAALLTVIWLAAPAARLALAGSPADRHPEQRKTERKTVENHQPAGGSRGKRLAIRLTAAACLCAIALGLCHNLQDEDFQDRHRLYPFLFTPNVLIKYNGIAVSFVMEMKYLWVEKPEGYEAEKAEEILKTAGEAHSSAGDGYSSAGDAYSSAGEAHSSAGDFSSSAGKLPAATGPSQWPDRERTARDGTAAPTIIAIMDEAFSDLSVLGDFPVSEDYMPFVHTMLDGAENTISGKLHVSVCGGNTANTEFEFLTGNTMAFLPVGSIPYQQYIRRQLPSLASVLKEQGYVTYAQHPYYGSGWERERVYPLLGFEQMDFVMDYAKRHKVRTYVDDETCFSHIIETFENKPEGRPAFIFNVTMQNHGGYTDTKSGFFSNVTADELKSQPLNQYLSLLKLTDEKLQELIAYFKAQEEPVMLVFFGDHQPNDTVAGPVMKWAAKQEPASDRNRPAEDEDEENPLRYQVPFFIWANYDLEEKSGIETSANYLGCHVLKLAGLELSPYQNFLMEQEKQVPVLSAVEQGEEELLEYQILQYYLLFD